MRARPGGGGDGYLSVEMVTVKYRPALQLLAVVHPTPYTLHLHPTPYTLHSTPYALHPPETQLSQVVWAHQFDELGLFPAPKLTNLCRTPSMSS